MLAWLQVSSGGLDWNRPRSLSDPSHDGVLKHDRELTWHREAHHIQTISKFHRNDFLDLANVKCAGFVLNEERRASPFVRHLALDPDPMFGSPLEIELEQAGNCLQRQRER